jgi:hypothetical protein
MYDCWSRCKHEVNDHVRGCRSMRLSSAHKSRLPYDHRYQADNRASQLHADFPWLLCKCWPLHRNKVENFRANCLAPKIEHRQLHTTSSTSSSPSSSSSSALSFSRSRHPPFLTNEIKATAHSTPSVAARSSSSSLDTFAASRMDPKWANARRSTFSGGRSRQSQNRRPHHPRHSHSHHCHHHSPPPPRFHPATMQKTRWQRFFNSDNLVRYLQQQLITATKSTLPPPLPLPRCRRGRRRRRRPALRRARPHRVAMRKLASFLVAFARSAPVVMRFAEVTAAVNNANSVSDRRPNTPAPPHCNPLA